MVIVDSLYNSDPEVCNRIELICGKRPSFYKVDITDEAALDKVFEENPDIDNVIHFAALKVRIHDNPQQPLITNQPSPPRPLASRARSP